MSLPPAPSVEPLGEQPALPKVQVLSYLTQISSPTRVRIVAARGVMLMAWADLVLLVLYLALFAWRVYDWYDRFMSGVAFFAHPPPGAWHLALEGALRQRWSMLLLVPIIVAHLLSMFLSRKPVLRGSSSAATFVRTLLWPLMPIATVMAVVGPLIAFWALDPWSPHSKPNYPAALWFLCFPVCILTLLLVRDLCSLLLWVAQNPLTDKSPVPFLPGSAARAPDLPTHGVRL